MSKIKKVGTLNIVFTSIIAILVVFLIGAVVYQRTVLQTSADNENVIYNEDGTHTHIYTDEDGHSIKKHIQIQTKILMEMLWIMEMERILIFTQIKMEL